MIYALLYAIVLLLSSVNASTVRLLRSPHRRSDDLWFQISRNATISKYSRDPSLNHAKRQQTGAGSLTNVGSDSAYYIQFSIGTPAKQYNILLDTGSSDLWLASTECNVGCSNLQTLYSAGNQVSSTYDASNGLPFGVQYIGGNITGYTAHETVSLVGFTVTDQLFGVVTSFTTASTVLPPAVTGLMGLAWQPLARLGTPWWQRAATATPWSQPLFAFSLSRSTGMQEATGGRFSIGELDQTAYTGDIDYVNIPSGHQSWWLIPLSCEFTLNI
ncbi:hypothetical protein FRC03_002482 [Tulasnella sp. 419]|nr:hypothetical protein FRC03_002482 [Tulasnella sp. 419]